MKKSYLCIVALLVISVSAYAQISEPSEIKVSLINQEPNPVEPGEHLIIRLRVENLGSVAVENMKFELIPEFPLSLAEGSPIKDLGTIAGRQRDKIGVVVSYDMIVDSSASEGTEDFFVKYSSNSQGYVKLGPFNITIRARQAVASISSVLTETNEVMPGDKVNLTLFLTNNARSLLKDISVKLDLSAAATPFAPLSEAQEKSVGQLSPGETLRLPFSLISLPSASPGIYKVPVKISYSSQTGKNFTRDDLISLKIGGKPSVYAAISEQEVLKKGKTGELTIQIVNDGLIDAKLATLEILDSGDYDLLTPAKSYIGKLDSDDFDTAKLKIYVRSENLSIPVSISFKDANNNDYNETFVLKPKVYTPDQLYTYGLENGRLVGIVIALVIVGVGLLAYFRVRKRRE